MFNHFLILGAAGTVVERVGVCLVCLLVGAYLIYLGLQNVKTQTAEESGKRRITNKIMKKSNSYTGKQAVRVGWTRVGCGVMIIIFGIVFLFVGPVLKDLEKKNPAQSSIQQDRPMALMAANEVEPAGCGFAGRRHAASYHRQTGGDFVAMAVSGRRVHNQCLLVESQDEVPVAYFNPRTM